MRNRLREEIFRAAWKRPITFFIVVDRGATQVRHDTLIVNALVEQGPPVQVARHEVENRRIRRLLTETSIRLREARGTDDLHFAWDQVCNQPTHQIGTVNKE